MKCVDCDICIHNFVCTCPDSAIKFNICKHIHLVAMKLKIYNMPDSSAPANDKENSKNGNILLIDESVCEIEAESRLFTSTLQQKK